MRLARLTSLLCQTGAAMPCLYRKFAERTPLRNLRDTALTPTNSSRAARRRNGGGFTLIELMIVMAIITILLSIAVPMYQRSVQRARESVFKQDLQALRQSIDNYTLDKEAAPQSLDDLVQAGYMRELPIDPMTRERDWQPHFGDTVLSPDQTTTGIDDVHSNSDRTASDGTPYNTW